MKQIPKLTNSTNKDNSIEGYPSISFSSFLLNKTKKIDVSVDHPFFIFEKDSQWITDKFINLVMRDGKKGKAANLVFNMLPFLKKHLEKNLIKIHPLLVLSQAVENVIPSLEVRKVRVAGTTYLVPAILSKKKQQAIAIRWIIESAIKRQNNSKSGFSQCLADEIFDAFKKQGPARQKRDELHRLAEANRASIRYRWW